LTGFHAHEVAGQDREDPARHGRRDSDIIARQPATVRIEIPIALTCRLFITKSPPSGLQMAGDPD
jgi:hypothetical protein